MGDSGRKTAGDGRMEGHDKLGGGGCQSGGKRRSVSLQECIHDVGRGKRAGTNLPNSHCRNHLCKKARCL